MLVFPNNHYKKSNVWMPSTLKIGAYNKKARVGDNCCIHINTAIVAQGVSNGTPVIGNDVVIGVGSTVLGSIQIADGIAIGANSLVNKSFFEKGIAIAGVPAKKVSNNGKLKWGTQNG